MNIIRILGSWTSKMNIIMKYHKKIAKEIAK